MLNNSTTFFGLDLGDKHSHFAILDLHGDLIEEIRIPTSKAFFQRKFSGLPPARVAMEVGTHSRWASHQSLSQLTPRMLGALSNFQTKIVFTVGRSDSEQLAKMIGRVDSEAVKRDPKTDIQYELLEPIANQWEQWVDHIRFQKPRHALVARQDGDVANIRTITIPAYSATDDDVEEFKVESLKRYGIPYSEAIKNLEKPAYEEPVTVIGPPGPGNYGR